MAIRGLGLVAAAAVISGCIFPATAADLVWEVENPFRFHKSDDAFAMHHRAFEAVRGEDQASPSDIVWRIERHLNAPTCGDPATAVTCANSVSDRRRFAVSRLGWAARTLDDACYESDGRPRRYPSVCLRSYGKRRVKEDYVLPASHVVSIALAAAHREAAGEGSCAWSWQPRAGGEGGTRSQPCKTPLSVDAPYAKDRAKSGIAVSVTLPDGSRLADPEVVVEDLLIVALGDSFASGESNPDRPVTFGNREYVYGEPRDEFITADGGFARRDERAAPPPPSGINPRALPRRFMDDERQGLIHHPQSPQFAKAFKDAAAQWMSADCHRSQYGYPFRVAMQLALEDRRRAVTLVHLACSGAQVTEGLFVSQDAREGAEESKSAKVRAQFDQLTDLICRDGPKGRRGATYSLPFFKYGEAPAMRVVTKRWCPPDRRKRDIDLVMLSIGGNDVGFSAIAAYTITESAGDIAPIAGWLGRSVRFAPAEARQYLPALGQRLTAVRDALRTGFGVAPERVVQTSYEPIQYDETGALCGSQPTLGLDVHPNLKLSRARLKESADFLDSLVGRLECISGSRSDCRPQVPPAARTGFTLVTEHHVAFRRRGICARDPKRPDADGVAMAMPRLHHMASAFKPYHPAYFTPYAGRWRLFRTPNDAFLTAHTHHETSPLYDLLQPAYAGLFSGAIHPTAEAHAIVADYVVPHARRVVGSVARVEASGSPAR